VARSLGLPIPDGDIALTARDARHIAGRLGCPVMLKEARTQARVGVHAAVTPESLDAILSSGTLRFPLVVQRMMAGEEIGVEILSTGTGSCRFPPVSTGDMDSRCDPAARVRSSPRLLPRPAQATITQIIDILEKRLRPYGPWQLDLALSGEDVVVLEMNGRLGGLADLGLGATGFDSHRLFGELLLGRRLPCPSPVAVAMEIPVAPDLVPPPSGDSVQVSVLTGSPANPFPADWNYGRFSLRSADQTEVERWVSQLDPATLRVPIGALRVQADRAFDCLRAVTPASAQ
jgi:biotin carboxylase